MNVERNLTKTRFGKTACHQKGHHCKLLLLPQNELQYQDAVTLQAADSSSEEGGKASEYCHLHCACVCIITLW